MSTVSNALAVGRPQAQAPEGDAKSQLFSQDAWTTARNRYVEDLTDEEKHFFCRASPEMLLYDASAAEKRHGEHSSSRGLMAKIHPLTVAIEQYGAAIDVYTNAYPLVLSPLWGSVRVVLHIAREFSKYFEKLLEMFARLGDGLPRFKTYERLFPNHRALIQKLSDVYLEIILFCISAKAVFRHAKRASMISLKVAFKVAWKPFDIQFGSRISKIRELREDIEREADIAHMTEAAASRSIVLANQAQLERLEKDASRNRIISSIPSVDYRAKHQKLQSLRYTGTCVWMLRTEAYTNWKYAQNSASVCCLGIPGSGKSILASQVVDDLLNDPRTSDSPINYYYCDYTDQRTLQSDHILGTLLKQLLLTGSIPAAIEDHMRSLYGLGSHAPGTIELTRMYYSIVASKPRVYVVIDGLDECDKSTRRDILSFLNGLEDLAQSAIKLFISCRNEDEIVRSIAHFAVIQITADLLQHDIELFVGEIVRSRIESHELRLRNANLEGEITRQLVSKAKGLFLWVFFQVEDLCEAPSDAAIREVLQNLPDGLMETYERILSKITRISSRIAVAKKVLGWIMYAVRPLRVEELREAVAFDVNDTHWISEKLPNEDIMIESCRSLVVRDKIDGTVRLAHHTIQQYLSSIADTGDQQPTFSPLNARILVGQTCITYLSFSDFKSQLAHRKPDAQLKSTGILSQNGPMWIPSVLGFGKSISDFSYRLLGGNPARTTTSVDFSKWMKNKPKAEERISSEFMKKYCFLAYVVDHWPIHTQVFSRSNTLAEGFEHHIRDFQRFILYAHLSFEFRPWGVNEHFGPFGCVGCPPNSASEPSAAQLPYMSLFHYAAATGHIAMMETLVQEYCNHERFNDETLLIACRHSQLRVVRHLLETYAYDISDGRAVNAAAAAGDSNILNFLLQAGMHHPDSLNNTLPRTTRHGMYSVPDNGHVPLCIAAAKGHEGIVETFCRMSVQIDSRDQVSARNAIQEGAANGHDAVVRVLLAHDAKLHTSTTPLHLAAANGHDNVVRTLLTHSAGQGVTSLVVLRDKKDRRGETALEKARQQGHYATIQLLLDSCSSTELLNEPVNELHNAARNGLLDGVKNSVRDRGEMEKRTKSSGQTPLHLAASQGHVGVVQWLLHEGANICAKDNGGLTPISYAVKNGDYGTLHIMLELAWGSTTSIAKEGILTANFFKQQVATDMFHSFLADQGVDPPEYILSRKGTVLVGEGGRLERHLCRALFDRELEDSNMITSATVRALGLVIHRLPDYRHFTTTITRGFKSHSFLVKQYVQPIWQSDFGYRSLSSVDRLYHDDTRFVIVDESPMEGIDMILGIPFCRNVKCKLDDDYVAINSGWSPI